MKALLPVLNNDSNTPYYLQVYEYIKDAILSGDMAAGEKLPSLRNLSKSVKLSITTIDQAYSQLLVEGYIYSKPQSGYYVSKISAISAPSDQTVPTKTTANQKKLSLESRPFQFNPPKLQYDAECFDFNKWKKCTTKIMNDFSPYLFFEGEPRGEELLREEIARYLYQSRGVSATSHQIIIGAGTQQITNYLATLLSRINISHVALEKPSYKPVRNTFRDRGFTLTDIEVKEDGLALEKLPSNIRAVTYTSPSNHTYTGAVMPVGRRYELLHWATANDSYIIEDDYDSELRYFGRPIPPITSLDEHGRVIYLGSFSSTLFAALRISYMVLPEKLADLFEPIAQEYSQTTSKLEQLALAMFMGEGYYQTHIKKLRNLYSQKLEALIDSFGTYGSDFIKTNNTSSGMSVIINVASDKDGSQLKKDAESLGIPTVVINDDLAKAPDKKLLLYYNQIPLGQIAILIRRLCELWRAPSA